MCLAYTDASELATNSVVRPGISPHKDAVGAAADGLREGHRRMDAEFPCLVGGRGHDAAEIGLLPTDDERFPDKVGVQDLFDGGEEGVHIDVEDAAFHVGDDSTGVGDAS